MDRAVDYEDTTASNIPIRDNNPRRNPSGPTLSDDFQNQASLNDATNYEPASPMRTTDESTYCVSESSPEKSVLENRYEGPESSELLSKQAVLTICNSKHVSPVEIYRKPEEDDAIIKFDGGNEMGKETPEERVKTGEVAEDSEGAERERNRVMKTSGSNEDILQYEDQSFPQLLQDSIRDLALDGQFYDVILEVEGHKFKCHRLILSGASPYFRAMFCNGHREKNQHCITIGGVTADVMKILIRYAYTSHLDLDSENCQDVMEAAALLQFNRVVQVCADYLTRQVTIENAPGAMELAHRHGIQSLLTYSRLQCVTKFEQLLEKSDFVNLSSQLLESIICRPDLVMTREENVYHLVMAWCRHCPEERKRHLARLLGHVKLPLLEHTFFVREVEADPLIACNPDLHQLMMECRLFHSEGKISNLNQVTPRKRDDVQQVFVTVGGCDQNDEFARDVCVFDFNHKSRAEICQLPNVNRTLPPQQKIPTKWAEFACCEWLGNLVMTGGKETKKEAWLFLMALRRWIDLPRLNTGRWRHRMVTCRGCMFVVGGFDGLLRVDNLEKYNTRESIWEEVSSMPVGVSSPAACVANDKIYILGGGTSVEVATDKVQVYDPETSQWRLDTPMPQPSKCLNAVSINETIYVVGGALNKVMQLDTRSGSWTICVFLKHERASCGVTVCCGKIFIVGGRSEDGRAISNISYVDVESKEVHSECNMGRGISHHGCVSLHRFVTAPIKAV